MISQQFYHTLKERHHPCVIRIMFKTGNAFSGDIASYPEQKSIFPLSGQFTSQELKAMVKEASDGTGK